MALNSWWRSRTVRETMDAEFGRKAPDEPIVGRRFVCWVCGLDKLVKPDGFSKTPGKWICQPCAEARARSNRESEFPAPPPSPEMDMERSLEGRTLVECENCGRAMPPRQLREVANRPPETRRRLVCVFCYSMLARGVGVRQATMMPNRGANGRPSVGNARALPRRDEERLVEPEIVGPPTRKRRKITVGERDGSE